ncbi:hypothetical protein HYH02_010136 [Chlamydomonas schloesseri]|uniref:Uncharacterized protein n=1 Tax=Chlamydomonas schloesseri TaxID=2026947 RepID=A0A835TBD5_9CHLO|nr:hypothetical protein HYH02_010136 [Chlamydomonas schloesseri]|eukprot:KAG2440552.1 hypothetical protein HYH02_010136 [Chlamydomonas schloesseri]
MRMPTRALSGSATRSRRQGGPSDSSGRGFSSSLAPLAPPPHPSPLLPDLDREHAEASPQPARFDTPRSSWCVRHSWSGSGQAHDTQLPEAAASAVGYTTASPWRTPEQQTNSGAGAWPAGAARPAALSAAGSSSNEDEEATPLVRGMLEAERGVRSFTSGGSATGAFGLERPAGAGAREPPCSSSGRGRLPPFPAAFAAVPPAAAVGPCPVACSASFLSHQQQERLRWLWQAVLRPFWPAPAAALVYALALRALGYRGSVTPGTQAIFIMCWLQCCFGVLSRQGRRTALRLAQLAAALVGVLLLLPRHSAYNAGELGLRFGVPSGYDEDGGVDGDYPALSAWGGGWSWGGLLGLLGVDMGSLSDGSGQMAGGAGAGAGAAGLHGSAAGAHAGGAAAGGGGAVESLAELELHRALMRVQVALGVVLGLWLLQAAVACVVLPAAVAATAASSAAAAVGGGSSGSGCGSPANSPQRGAAGSPAAAAGASAGGASNVGGGGALLKALGVMTPQKSHLDLPALDAYEALQASGGLGTVFGRREGSGTSAAWEVLRSYGTGAAAAAAAGGGAAGCIVCGGTPVAPPSSAAGTPRPVAGLGGKLPQGPSGVSVSPAQAAVPHGGCCVAGGGVGTGGGLHHTQQAAALAATLLTQRLLMWVALAAQLVAAAALTGMWEVPTERVELSHGVALLSVSRDGDNKRWLYGGPGRSWLAVLVLAAAMAAPLPLPHLLRSRHAVLWHTALLLRPAASRPLGLRLLDCNAAKLITGVAVGLLFASWAAAIFSWQLLQVATLVGGLVKLYLDGVRQQVRQHVRQQGLGCPGASAVTGPGGGGSGAYALQLSEGGGHGGVCNGVGNGIGGSCYADAVREASSAAAAAAAPGPSQANGHGHHDCIAGGMFGNGNSAALANGNGNDTGLNGHGAFGCPSSADAPCSPVAAGGSSGGSSAELVLSSCSSSGYSLNSTSIAMASGCEKQGYSGNSSSRDVVTCLPLTPPGGSTPGASGASGGGGANGNGQVWHGGGGAHLARRVLPAAASAPMPALPGHHGPVPPLSPGSGLGAGSLGGAAVGGGSGLAACHSVVLGAGATGAAHAGASGDSFHYNHHHFQHQQAHHVARHVGFAEGGGGAAFAAAASGGGCAASLAETAACGRRYARAALRPWSLLLASLTALACCLWAILITPPLAVLGDGPSDLYMGVLETAAGTALLVAVLVAAALSGVCSVVMLAACAASGELRRRWSGDRLEGRRLQCLAWAAGPAAAVAAASALSWALGDERNVLVFVAAESLHCACLWPLVWLQEPWLLGGVHDVGGCVQHAGCGVTCCVLRWVGLRPGYPRGASATARCDVPGGGGAASSSSGGGGGSGSGGGVASGARDGGDAGGGVVVRGQSARRGGWSLQVQVN